MALTELKKPAGRRASGFTLIEVLVTIVVLSVVGVALAATMQYATRTLRRSRDELAAAAFLRSTVEHVRLVPYDSVVDGSRGEGRGTAVWTVQDSATFRQVLVVTRYGSPAHGQIVDSVSLFRSRR